MKGKIIEAVIFDMDGVLTESMQYHIISWKYALNQFNIFPTESDLCLLEGMSYKETVDVLSEKYSVQLEDSDKERIYSLKKSKLEDVVQYRLYPHVEEILKLLKANNIRLALVSGANSRFVQNIVKEFFEDVFEIVVTGSDVEKGKPNPEPYVKAVHGLQCPKEHIVVIENAPLGITSAKGANLTTYALSTTLDKTYLTGADIIFFSHKDLLSYFKEHILNNQRYQ